MEYVTLGRTGLQASIIGLGCGGPSRLGQRTGRSEKESIAVVRRAIDLGINFIDTAEAYGTESIVGRAIKNVKREEIIVSTKKQFLREGKPVIAGEVAAGVEQSLDRLGMDYVDIFHLHGVILDEYQYATEAIVPTLFKLREQGKIRFLGITERFHADPQHHMLQRALQDKWWDVMMVGFNILNQSARERVFPKTIEKDIGVLVMFAVRRAFSRSDRLREIMRDLAKDGLVDPAQHDEDEPLDFLLHEDGAFSLPDAAYRYVRHERGVHVVLSGTGNRKHLEENVDSILRPPLPSEDLLKLEVLFAGVDSVAGD